VCELRILHEPYGLVLKTCCVSSHDEQQTLLVVIDNVFSLLLLLLLLLLIINSYGKSVELSPIITEVFSIV